MLKGNEVIWMFAACAAIALIIRLSAAVSSVVVRIMGVITVPPISTVDWQLGGKCLSSHTDYTVQHL
jgi:uncharacterized protein (DUF2062 family)